MVNCQTARRFSKARNFSYRAFMDLVPWLVLIVHDVCYNFGAKIHFSFVDFALIRAGHVFHFIKLPSANGNDERLHSQRDPTVIISFVQILPVQVTICIGCALFDSVHVELLQLYFVDGADLLQIATCTERMWTKILTLTQDRLDPVVHFINSEYIFTFSFGKIMFHVDKFHFRLSVIKYRFWLNFSQINSKWHEHRWEI